jgi:hypothetical protein
MPAFATAFREKYIPQLAHWAIKLLLINGYKLQLIRKFQPEDNREESTESTLTQIY